MTLSCATSPDFLTVAPGGNAVWRVTVENPGDRATDAVLTVDGVPPDWVDIAPQRLHLHPQQQGEVVVTITPSFEPDGTRIDLPVTITVNDPHRPEAQESLNLMLRVTATDEFGLGPLIPRDVELPWYRRRATFILPLANNSGRPVMFQLMGEDEDCACQVAFSAPETPDAMVGKDHLLAAPWLTTFVNVHVRPGPRQIVGLTSKVFHCAMTAAVQDDPTSRRSVLGKVLCPPVVSPLTLLLLVLCVTMAALLVSRLATQAPLPDMIKVFQVANP